MLSRVLVMVMLVAVAVAVVELSPSLLLFVVAVPVLAAVADVARNFGKQGCGSMSKNC